MRNWGNYLNTMMVRQPIQCIAMRLGQAIQYGALRANPNSGQADIKWSKTINVLLVKKPKLCLAPFEEKKNNICIFQYNDGALSNTMWCTEGPTIIAANLI